MGATQGTFEVGKQVQGITVKSMELVPGGVKILHDQGETIYVNVPMLLEAQTIKPIISKG